MSEVMPDRTQLIEAELDTLYLISQVLNSTHELHAKLHAVLEILHKRSGMCSGMITLKEIENNSLIVSVVHTDHGDSLDQSVRYNPGEGLLGAILDAGSTIVVEKIAEEPRFLGRLGLYNPDLPFIGSPIYVEEGDTIEIDIPNRTIHLKVDDATLASRRAAMEAKGAKAWKPVSRERVVSPALRAYAAMSTSAAKGAVRDVSQIEKK